MFIVKSVTEENFYIYERCIRNDGSDYNISEDSDIATKLKTSLNMYLYKGKEINGYLENGDRLYFRKEEDAKSFIKYFVNKYFLFKL